LATQARNLFDLLVQRVPLQEGIILLLLDPLGDGLLVSESEVTRGRLALFLGFGALQGDLFLHDISRLKGQRKGPLPAGAIRILPSIARRLIRVGAPAGQAQPDFAPTALNRKSRAFNTSSEEKEHTVLWSRGAPTPVSALNGARAPHPQEVFGLPLPAASTPSPHLVSSAQSNTHQRPGSSIAACVLTLLPFFRRPNCAALTSCLFPFRAFSRTSISAITRAGSID
jgi:hypothetical protein